MDEPQATREPTMTNVYILNSLENLIKSYNIILKGFPCSSVGKEFTCSARDPGSIPGLRRSPGEGNGNPFQYPCLENFMDTGAWWAAVRGVSKSREQLSDYTYLLTYNIKIKSNLNIIGLC